MSDFGPAGGVEPCAAKINIQPDAGRSELPVRLPAKEAALAAHLWPR